MWRVKEESVGLLLVCCEGFGLKGAEATRSRVSSREPGAPGEELKEGADSRASRVPVGSRRGRIGAAYPEVRGGDKAGGVGCVYGA